MKLPKVETREQRSDYVARITRLIAENTDDTSQGLYLKPPHLPEKAWSRLKEMTSKDRYPVGANPPFLEQRKRPRFSHPLSLRSVQPRGRSIEDLEPQRPKSKMGAVKTLKLLDVVKELRKRSMGGRVGFPDKKDEDSDGDREAD